MGNQPFKLSGNYPDVQLFPNPLHPPNLGRFPGSVLLLQERREKLISRHRSAEEGEYTKDPSGSIKFLRHPGKIDYPG